MIKRRQYRELGDAELSLEAAARFDALEAEAEEELEELRVNFRWGSHQVEMVKLAAEMMGVPYQTYIKEAAFRQAIADVRAATIAQRIKRTMQLKKGAKPSNEGP